MSLFDSLVQNLTQPVFLFFVLGLILVLLKTGYEYPPQLYKAITLYLLVAIGLHGGIELKKADPGQMALLLGAGFVVNGAIGVVSYFVLRYLGRFGGYDAAAVAGHYGSVSAAAYAAAIGFLGSTNMPYDSFMSALLAAMEIPGVIVALVAAKFVAKAEGEHDDHGWGPLIKEVFASPGALILILGIVIGYIEGHDGLKNQAALFDGLFKGILCLYMIEMGMTTASRLSDVAKAGVFLVVFGLAAPAVFGSLGVVLAKALGVQKGSAVLMGVLTGSSSFIAVPAAVREAIPQASPSLYMAASLGVTFPFVVSVGIPLYAAVAAAVYP